MNAETTMDCAAITDLVPEYIRRRLPAAGAAAARAHLATCATCAAAYEEELAFARMLHGTDAATPPQMLPQIMASVRAAPQIVPASRLRPLDVAVAFACAIALSGMIVAVGALQAILPVIGSALDLRALFGGSAGSLLLLTVVFSGIGLAIILGVGAAVHTATNRARDPYLS